MIFMLLAASESSAQFSPPAGMEGSAAIAADSSIIARWGDSVAVNRGPMYIANPGAGLAGHGQGEHARGPADMMAVSLGDGGSATFVFDPPLQDSPGPDIAVFENSFDDNFLELAFVAISSDGETFITLPAVSLTQMQEQVGPFGTLEAEKLHNLAGKYRGGYGVPFDFEELEGHNAVNIMMVSHVKITDVVGSVDDTYASFDSEGNIINDPYPTNFNTGGFDLDAVALLKDTTQVGIAGAKPPIQVDFYPNPVKGKAKITVAGQADFSLFDMNSRIADHGILHKGTNTISWGHLPGGIYVLQLYNDGLIFTKKIVIR
jgi:hypothetical protein